ncbi:MAG: hypothetical protein JW788_04545 [Candidatus Omnitrophica bacterium]|nr:hypothetical protein [Candidatus Omnitrophota bacterium]
MKKIILLIVLTFFAFILPAFCAQVTHIGHFELLDSYSSVKRGNPISGYDINGYYSPVVKLDKTLFLIPLYTVQFEKIRQYLPEDEGNHLSTVYFVQNAVLSLRKEFKPNWYAKATALGTWSYNKETRDENWGKGLYDYQDAGWAFDVRHKKKGQGYQQEYSVKFEYYRRRYPNFSTLLSSTSPAPPERREKDYLGYKYIAGFNHIYADGSRLYLKPYFLVKYFTDKYTIEEDGTLNTDKRRKDYVLNIDYGLSKILAKGLLFSLDNSYTYNTSNLDFYDSQDTVSLSDDAFTKDFYVYHKNTLTPSFEYSYSLGEKKEVKFKAGYTFAYRDYENRKVQSVDGGYSNKRQKDREHSVFSSLAVPINKNLDALLKYSYTWVRSNQDYQAYYRYTYDAYRIEAGLGIDF